MFGEGVSGPRHFDFSEAPDVPGFNSSAECDADYTMGGHDAYVAFLARGETKDDGLMRTPTVTWGAKDTVCILCGHERNDWAAVAS